MTCGTRNGKEQEKHDRNKTLENISGFPGTDGSLYCRAVNLSKQAAKLIGVTLSVDSTPGCGSRFSVTFEVEGSVR